MKTVALIGFGAIGTAVVDAWPEGFVLVGVLVKSAHIEAARNRLPASVAIVSNLFGLLELHPDIVVETAGHAAVIEFGEDVLHSGAELHLLSVGALANDCLRERLTGAAIQSKGRIVLPSGALAGFDGLRSMKVAGLQEVKYTCAKPVAAWRGTPAEDRHNLDDIKTATTVFAGNAREAAEQFPRNANLAAAIALAGFGFDHTKVELVADPNAACNNAWIEAHTLNGVLRLSLESAAFDDNPKSSQITAASVVAGLVNGAGPIGFV